MFMFLQVITTFATLVFYIAALVYILSRTNDGSGSKGLAATAVSILLFLHVFQFVFSLVVVRMMDMNMTAAAFQAYSAVTAIGWMFAIGMLIRAAFLKSPLSPGFESGFTDPGTSGAPPVPSDNPYRPSAP